MTGIVTRLDPKGFGVIEARDGSKFAFLFTDVLNHRLLKVGQRVVFSVRRIQDKALAENIGPETARSPGART
jgi:cold shock CspA family protein